jgi:hypothetical protein
VARSVLRSGLRPRSRGRANQLARGELSGGFADRERILAGSTGPAGGDPAAQGVVALACDLGAGVEPGRADAVADLLTYAVPWLKARVTR